VTLKQLWILIHQLLEELNTQFALFVQAILIPKPSTMKPSQLSKECSNQPFPLEANLPNSITTLVITWMHPPAFHHLNGTSYPCIPPWPPPLIHPTKNVTMNQIPTTTPVQCCNIQTLIWKKDSLHLPLVATVIFDNIAIPAPVWVYQVHNRQEQDNT